MRIAIYARVSKDEGSEDHRYQEPENQLEPLRAWAKANNWEIVHEFVDRESGANPNRQQLKAMLEQARVRKFDTILVWKLDRLSREPMLHTLSYLSQLKRWNVAVKSQTESWLDTSSDNPMSDVVLAVMSWAASEERRKISERTKAGIQRLKNIGQWKGGRPRKGGPIVSSTVGPVAK